MKSQRLIDALGQIDERLVLDVIPTPVQKKKPRWPAVLSAAAMVGLCIFGASRLKLPSPGQAQPKTEKPTVDVVYEVDPADPVQEALPMLSLGTDYLGDSAEIAYVSDRGQLLDLGIQDFSQLPETLPVYQNLYAENELRQREGWEPDYDAWTEELQALIEQLGLEGTTEIDELHGQVRFYGSDDEVISVDSQQNIVLYNAVDLTLDETVDESSADAMEEAGRYLLQNYDFGFSDPVSTVCSYSQNFSAYLYDGAGSLADQLLSLSFRGIQCYFSQGRLYMLSIRNTQLGDLVGNYPILTPEEAEQLLRQGAGLSMVPADSADFEIGAMGLVYLNQPWLDYYLPFYWFRVALPENSPYQTANENHAYTLYYLPAVEPAYISDLPHWELTADPAEAIGAQLSKWDGVTMDQTIRTVFGSYFALHAEDLQFLPEFEQGTAPGWNAVTRFVLRTKSGYLSQEEMAEILNSYFGPMTYTDQSSDHMRYADGYYEGPAEEYQDESIFYRLETLKEIEPGIYEAVFEGFALLWTDLNPGYESPASENRIALSEAYGWEQSLDHLILEALCDSASLEQLGMEPDDRMTVTFSLQEGEQPFRFLSCHRTETVEVKATQGDLELWVKP